MVTHAEPSSRTPEQQTEHAIVVGVDSRGRSVSALVWAVEEAERTNRSLTMLSARSGEGTTDLAGQHDLGALARRLTLTHVRQREVVGEPVDALLRAAREAELLVVGCRTTRPAQRLLMGSTSRTVACWSPVPLVVVPEAWMQPSLAAAPLVAGVRPMKDGTTADDEPDREVLDFAFSRAAVLKVPLIVVSSWDVPSLYAWSPADLERVHREHEEALHHRLDGWREVHPEVELVVRSVAEASRPGAPRDVPRLPDGRRGTAPLGGAQRPARQHHAPGPARGVPSRRRGARGIPRRARARPRPADASAGLPWAPSS